MHLLYLIGFSSPTRSFHGFPYLRQCFRIRQVLTRYQYYKLNTQFIKELQYLFKMSRTKFNVDSSYRIGMGYFGKSKRSRIKPTKRSTRHSLRNQNKYADQLRFIILKNYTKRKNYKTYDLPKEVFGRRLDWYRQQLFKPNDQLKDSMRKRLQQSLRKLRSGQYYNYSLRKSPKLLSDLFTAAHKKLKRRGNLLPFAGHRERGVLYKRQLTYWQ